MESTFAVVSVSGGHEELERRVRAGRQVPVTIRGFVDDTWGDFDGVDQEFSVRVTSIVEEGE